jgi:cell division protein FtsQ
MTSTDVRIDPRIRERRIEVQREAGRRRLRVLVIAMGVICTLGVGYLMITSPLLDIDRMQIRGMQHVTAGAVRAASGVHTHDALLLVDTGAVARRVEALPWVQRAVVHRDFPGTLRISVTEYAPTAYVRTAGGVLLVAANGRALATVMTAPHGIVEIKGVRRAPALGEPLAPADAAGVVGRLPRALAHQVAAVDVAGGLALSLARGGSIRLGNDDQLDAKAASALAVLAHLGNAHFTYIDVTTPARPTSKD